MTMRALIFTMMLAATPGFAQVATDSTRTVPVVDFAIACRSPDDLRRAVQMSVDEAAFKEFMVGKIIGATCTFFDVGDSVYVTGAARSLKQYRVRKQGDPREFWVYENALKK